MIMHINELMMPVLPQAVRAFAVCKRLHVACFLINTTMQASGSPYSVHCIETVSVLLPYGASIAVHVDHDVDTHVVELLHTYSHEQDLSWEDLPQVLGSFRKSSRGNSGAPANTEKAHCKTRLHCPADSPR